ncbi:hypothetical protein GA0074695_2994 [Micromonospora viridifaciens]|uniref:Uncharacterized protein n=1 Tax=Micromonospora viridifaciens TaxID=1881 RepID=A0A1C4X4B1_MICVI|nr:hypothetical protein [Micromonospora viridifaciens]SCF03244.1 hypothetical protein GA0074695_2994 [Micromonospora viridifaciens]
MTGHPDGGFAAIPTDDPRPELNAPGSPGAYGIDARGSQGVQISVGGTHTQTNIFQLLPRPPSRNKLLALAAVAGVVMTSAGDLWWMPGDASPTPSPSTPTRTASSPTWPAKIANTPRGTFGYPGPFADPQHRKPAASFFEGDVLRIVCQEQHGRVIKDSTTNAQSTVWNKLDTNVWVSNLYTDLPAGEAGRPPLGIPNCTY